jgi:GrpB-like predicted nucleotidyltransferase (UPF0157 family)
MIEIMPYQDRWPQEFLAIGSAIGDTLGNNALRVDHIGSTSVPGLDSKDVIDVQLTVASFENFDRIRQPLEEIGYLYREAVRSDHRPFDHILAGTFAYDSDWEKRYFSSAPGARRIHLHVRAAGRPNQRYALLFRDFLRHAPQTAACYAATKRALAQYHADNSTAYVTIKDPVCDLIMVQAEAWAAQTDWQPSPSDI